MCRKVEVHIECENAAFDECPADEVERLLKQAATIVQGGLSEASGRVLRDLNGNSVGYIEIF